MHRPGPEVQGLKVRRRRRRDLAGLQPGARQMAKPPLPTTLGLSAMPSDIRLIQRHLAGAKAGGVGGFLPALHRTAGRHRHADAGFFVRGKFRGGLPATVIILVIGPVSRASPASPPRRRPRSASARPCGPLTAASCAGRTLSCAHRRAPRAYLFVVIPIGLLGAPGRKSPSGSTAARPKTPATCSARCASRAAVSSISIWTRSSPTHRKVAAQSRDFVIFWRKGDATRGGE